MESYADRVLRLTVRLEQLSKSASRDTRRILRKMQKEVLGALLANNIDTKKVLDRVRREVRDISIARYAEIDEILFNHESMTAQAAHQVEIRSYAALADVGKIFVEMRDIEKIVADAFDIIMPGLGGRQTTVKDMLKRFGANSTGDMMNIATRAYIEGLPVSAITQMVRDSTELQERQAEAVARTAIQATANQARQDVADNLPVDKEIWMATLDSSTCQFCQGLDGKCKPKGTFPRLAHPNCRCVRLYVPDDRSCKQVKADLTRVQRGPDDRSKPLNKYKTFGEWILTQPVAFQKEVLGVERSQLLREGKVQFDKMYTASGKRKTVADIKKHYL